MSPSDVSEWKHSDVSNWHVGTTVALFVRVFSCIPVIMTTALN